MRLNMLRAKQSVSPEAQEIREQELKADAGSRSYTQGASIAPQSDSSFVIIDSKEVMSHQWADRYLKAEANRFERVTLAVRDAARCAERKRLNPLDDEIYVTSSIRKSWGLSSDQLSKGLKDLEAKQMIKVTSRRKGKHARLVLVAKE